MDKHFTDFTAFIESVANNTEVVIREYPSESPAYEGPLLTMPTELKDAKYTVFNASVAANKLQVIIIEEALF